MSKIIIIAAIAVVYLLIGFSFTILKSNSYYDSIINKEDVYQKNGKSYWENRCVEENNNPSNKGNPWCWDKNGNFPMSKPSKTEWYSNFMWKDNGRMITPIFFWPFHFIGFDMIHYKVIGFSD